MSQVTEQFTFDGRDEAKNNISKDIFKNKIKPS